MSDPEQIIYNQSLYSSRSATYEDTIGPQVIHRYGIMNEGPSDIDEAEIVILWPMRTLNSKLIENVFYYILKLV